MKINLNIFLLLILVTILTFYDNVRAQTVYEKGFSCFVVSVHDGDTFTCQDKTKIRIWGVDTPEIPPKVKKPQPGGIEAKNYLTRLIKNQNLVCVKKGSSYKRVVAKCYINNVDIAEKLLNDSMAKEVIKYSKGFYNFAK